MMPYVTKEIKALVESGTYRNRSEVIQDAMRVLLETKPNLRIEIAVEMFKEGETNLGRSAEMAGVSREEFKEILSSRGVKKIVTADEGMDERIKGIEEVRK
ncbi:MAG: UPF0175 family protein [Candidatus Altiarchaeota archaeon]|nr:UPF0175 family protein [Candidatus Altiarchaeota archaeon]